MAYRLLERRDPMKETNVTFLRRQADVCIALSRSTFDLTVAGRLRVMAEELRERSLLHDDDTDCASSTATRRDRTGGNRDRD
jgi:hypothetical protein